MSGRPHLNPTSFLPPLAKLLQCPPVVVLSALQKIEDLYFPTLALPPASDPRFRARIAKEHIVPDSGYASAEEEGDVDETSDNSDLEAARGDPLQRLFVIKWLTGFISRSDHWTQHVHGHAAEGRQNAKISGFTPATIVEKAASLLTSFAGSTASTEDIVRSFTFPSTGPQPVVVELNDAASDDFSSVGLASWGAGILFAALMSKNPTSIVAPNARPVRILELGAGTGMLSIVARRLYPTATIVATDYHQEVLRNLEKNINHNIREQEAVTNVQKFDWQTPHFTPPFDSRFDVILAADVIYNPHHARWIMDCVHRLLAKPSSGITGGVFWLAIPIRSVGRHEGLYRTVNESLRPPCDLAILEERDLERHEHFGRVDETGYKLYKIGWAGDS